MTWSTAVDCSCRSVSHGKPLSRPSGDDVRSQDQINRGPERLCLINVHGPLFPGPGDSTPSPLGSMVSEPGDAQVAPIRILTHAPDEWASPAFMRRTQLSASRPFQTSYDPFASWDDEGHPRSRKKVKFARLSGDWKYADVDSNPDSDAHSSPISQPSPVPERPVHHGASVAVENLDEEIASPVKAIQETTKTDDEEVHALDSDDHIPSSHLSSGNSSDGQAPHTAASTASGVVAGIHEQEIRSPDDVHSDEAESASSMSASEAGSRDGSTEDSDRDDRDVHVEATSNPVSGSDSPRSGVLPRTSAPTSHLDLPSGDPPPINHLPTPEPTQVGPEPDQLKLLANAVDMIRQNVAPRGADERGVSATTPKAVEGRAGAEATAGLFQHLLKGLWTSQAYFTTLAALPQCFGSSIDVLAINVHCEDTTRAHTGPRDFFLTLQVTDATIAPTTTTVQIFRPFRNALPRVAAGDAMLLRDFRVVSTSRKLGLISSTESAWLAWRGDGAREDVTGPPVELGLAEREWARDLRAWWKQLDVHVQLDSQPEREFGHQGRVGAGQAQEVTCDKQPATVEETVIRTKGVP